MPAHNLWRIFMKLFISILAFCSSTFCLADEPCAALSNYVGMYKQVSKTCESNNFGPTLEVTPYTETRPPQFSGYWIKSNGIGIGPSMAGDTLDHCSVNGTEVVVDVCGNSKSDSCVPRGWSFSFSGSQAQFHFDGCVATYLRQ
jgi:hypothetical protein